MALFQDEILDRLRQIERRLEERDERSGRIPLHERRLRLNKLDVGFAPVEGGGGGAGGGLTPAAHRSLDQLVHLIAEPSFEEYVYTGNTVDRIIVWTDATKTTKIREEIFTYTAGKVTTIVTKHYDASGVLVTGETMTETLSYTGNKLDDITRAVA